MAQQPSNNPTQRQQAYRIGRMGVVAGALFGLLTGGGLMGALQMAAIGGVAGAAGGVVAGDKLEPVFNKLGEMFQRMTGRGEKIQPTQPVVQHEPRLPGVAATAQEPMLDAQITEDYSRGPSPFRDDQLQQLLPDIEQARQVVNAQAHDANDNAKPGLPREWTRDAAAAQARPTHAGTSMRQ